MNVTDMVQGQFKKTNLRMHPTKPIQLFNNIYLLKKHRWTYKSHLKKTISIIWTCLIEMGRAPIEWKEEEDKWRGAPTAPKSVQLLNKINQYQRQIRFLQPFSQKTIVPKKRCWWGVFERHGWHWHTSSLVASREPMAAFKNLRLAIGLGSHLGSHHHNEDEKEDEE